MKLFIDKNINSETLAILITSLIVGVKLDIQKTEFKNKEEELSFKKKNPNQNYPFLEIDKFTSLYDPFAIMRYIASKQEKIPLITDDFNGSCVDEYLEIELKREKLVEHVGSHVQNYLVGVCFLFKIKKLKDNLTLADIYIWSLLTNTKSFVSEKDVEKNEKVQKWYKTLSEDKSFVQAVKVLKE
jgi:glutathione S-transferase